MKTVRAIIRHLSPAGNCGTMEKIIFTRGFSHLTASLQFPNTDILPNIVPKLLTWYRGQKDERELPWRKEPTAYHTWISEIMLQQTRATAVIPYYERFLAALPTIKALADVDDDALMKLWQGLGYYSRARNLKKAALVIMQEYNGELPHEFADLLKLPGIGRYTAGAIASIAYGKPQPAVDGNVLRVIMRVLACDEDIAKERTKKNVEAVLAPHYPSGKDAGDLNQAFMDLGATICLPHGEPHCGNCPLNRDCLAHAQNREQDFPVKSATKKRRVEQRTVLILRYNNVTAIHKRPNKGLLANLWEFPNAEKKLSKAEVATYLHERNLAASKIEPLPKAKHIFSHIEWQLTGWYIELADDTNTQVCETQDNLVWATANDLANIYSLPSAFQHYLPFVFQ